MAMILELGSPPLEIVRITAEYSNAVLVAVLPYIADVSQKLDLPVPRPVTQEHITHCSIKPLRNWGVEVGVGGTDGNWYFVFDSRRGYIDTIQGPREFFTIQDFDKISELYGEVKMSRAEAVQFGRDALRKLGISLESVFADQEPRVTEPVKFGTNTVPHYRIEWLDPRRFGRAPASVDMDINANTRRVERLAMSNKNLERPSPKLSVQPEREARGPRSMVFPRINPEYARQFIPIVLRAVDDYGQTLSLPIPRPLGTHHVARFSLQENHGGPYSKLALTNGWEFLYEHCMVTSFYAPDNLFNSDHRPILIKDFVGKWNMTEPQAVELVRRTLAKFNHPTNFIYMDFKPQVMKPTVSGIPRYMFRWDYSEEGDSMFRSAVSAEVDADKGEIKSLYYGNLAFWNRRPPIDVPLLLSPIQDTNSAYAPRIQTPPGAQPRRFKLPQEMKHH